MCAWCIIRWSKVVTTKRRVGMEKIIMANKKINYSFLIGLGKTAKNSAFMLIPFALAILAGMPGEYAWITGPVVYMLKNYFENKSN